MWELTIWWIGYLRWLDHRYCYLRSYVVYLIRHACDWGSACFAETAWGHDVASDAAEASLAWLLAEVGLASTDLLRVHAEASLAVIIVIVTIKAVWLTLVYVDIFKARASTWYGKLASWLALKHVIVYISIATNTSGRAYSRRLGKLIRTILTALGILLVLFCVKGPIPQFVSFLLICVILIVLIICCLSMRSAIGVIAMDHLLEEVIIHCCLSVAAAAIHVASYPTVGIAVRQSAPGNPISSLARIRNRRFIGLAVFLFIIIHLARQFAPKRHHRLWFIMLLFIRLIGARSVNCAYTISFKSTFSRLQWRIRRALGARQIDARRSEGALPIFTHSGIKLKLLFIFFVTNVIGWVLKSASSNSSLAYGPDWLHLIRVWV